MQTLAILWGYARKKGAPPFSAGLLICVHIADALTAKPSPARSVPKVETKSASSLVLAALRMALIWATVAALGVGEVVNCPAPG